jgi:hypothetical protein
MKPTTPVEALVERYEDILAIKDREIARLMQQVADLKEKENAQ